MSASDPLVIKLWIFAKILAILQPLQQVQAKMWFPSNEMQKSPNPSNEPLCRGATTATVRQTTLKG